MEFDFKALQFDYNSNLVATQVKTLGKLQDRFGKNIAKLDMAIQSNPILTSKEKVCNVVFGTTSPSLSYYIKENPNSNKVTETVEYNHKFVGLELKCKKSWNVLEYATKASPILYGFKKLDDYISSVELYAKVDFKFSVGADLNASFPFEREFSLTNKKSFGEGKINFAVDPKIKFEVTPIVGGQALGYYAEGSFDIVTELKCPIEYEPATTKLTFGDATLEPIKIKGFKLESFEKDSRGKKINSSTFEAGVEFSLWEKSIILYKKETIYIKDEN